MTKIKIKINIKKFDANDVKIVEKSYNNIFMYYIEYVTMQDLKYVKISSVNPLYIIFIKMSVYFIEINGNKHLTLVPINESRVIILMI